MKRAQFLLGRAGYWLVLAAILAFLIVPAVLVVTLSFSNDPMIAIPPREWGTNNNQKLLANPSWGHSAMLSVGLAIVVAAVSTAIAVPAAFALERTRLSRVGALSFAAILPMLVPQAAYAIGMYTVMAQLGLLGSAFGLAIAQVALCFPYVFVIVRAQLTRLSPDLDLVAMTLGASRTRAWIGISLRLLLPTILSGALLAFLTSFDEAVFASFLSGPGLITLPKAIFDSVRLGVDPVITAIATLLMLFTALVLAVATRLRRGGAAA
jgi:ABC-type spermidine/putrescine transport system permease subunit II